MKLHRMFSWQFGSRYHATQAALVLSDHEGCLNIASLFLDEVQVEPIMTSDVTRIVMRKGRAQFWTVEAHVTFDVGADKVEVEYSPYNFDGENDLPKLPTFALDGTPSLGEPVTWAAASPVELPVAAVVRVLDALDDAVSYGQARADDDDDADEAYRDEDNLPPMDGSQTMQQRVNEWDAAGMKLWASVPEVNDASQA